MSARILCFLLAVTCVGRCISTSHYEQDTPTCPDHDDIYPCTCSHTAESGVDLQCSFVQSEEQLANIFSSSFPSPNFHSLTITHNENLKFLKAGVFGNNTFEEFVFNYNLLEVVEVGALSASYSSATDMSFNDNEIATFPFEEVEHFTQLKRLSAHFNHITSFTPLFSQSLLFLDLTLNPIDSVSPTAFKGCPSLQEIRMMSAGLTDLASGNRIPCFFSA